MKKKMETTRPPCLDQAYYSKKKKVKEGDGEQKLTISPGLVLNAPKLYGLLKVEAHGASATPSYVKIRLFKEDIINALRSLLNSSARGLQV